MTNFLSTLKITAGAVILAFGLAAAPAMAQSGEPAAKFSLGIGNGQTELSIQGGGGENAKGGGGGNNNFGGGGGGGGGNSFNLCLSNRDVIRGLSSYGFRRVEILDSGRRSAEVVGRWGRTDYLMDVNKCTGEVDIIKRIRRGNNNGFGLQFNFN